MVLQAFGREGNRWRKKQKNIIEKWKSYFFLNCWASILKCSRGVQGD